MAALLPPPRNARPPRLLSRPARPVEPLESRRFLAATVAWAIGSGSDAYDYGGMVAADGAGGAVVAGGIAARTDFQPGGGVTARSPAGESDAFVARYSSRGKLLWVHNFGGGGYDDASAVAVDAEGAVLLAGRFNGSADFDPGPGVRRLSSAGGMGNFILKLSSAGELAWVGQIGGPAGGSIDAIAVDSAGNPVIVGGFAGTFDFSPTAGRFARTSRGNGDAFVARLSRNGKLCWAGTMGSADPGEDEYDFNVGDQAIAVGIDPTGNISVAGMFSGAAELDPTAAGTRRVTAAGLHDVFVVSLAPADGALRWAKTVGGKYSDRPADAAVDAAGDVYVTGTFEATADFDPGPGVANLVAPHRQTGDFAMRLRAGDGALRWAKSFDFGGFTPASIAVTPAGAYLTADFTGAVDFDPGPGTRVLHSTPGHRIFGSRMDSWDAFVLHLSPAGKFVDVVQWGQREWEIGHDVAADALGNLFVAGTFGGTVPFGATSLTAAGDSDRFLVKLLL